MSTEVARYVSLSFLLVNIFLSMFMFSVFCELYRYSSVAHTVDSLIYFAKVIFLLTYTVARSWTKRQEHIRRSGFLGFWQESVWFECLRLGIILRIVMETHYGNRHASACFHRDVCAGNCVVLCAQPVHPCYWWVLSQTLCKSKHTHHFLYIGDWFQDCYRRIYLIARLV